jgi:folate-dependent phosphoribosylglycinamide formyltransferase PurN
MLPDFGGVIGTKPVELALAAGRRTIGTTVHHVTEIVDCGPIISQSEIPVRQNEDFQDLMNRVFRAGCLNLFNAFRVLEGASTCVNSGRNYDDLLLSPWVITGDGWFSGEFWGTLKRQNDL